MKISEFAVKNYQFTIIIFTMLLVLGLTSLLTMPRGEDPPFNAPIYTVLAIYPGANPIDMEELVADPIEDALYELDDIKEIFTTCDDGLMIMQVEFTFGVDPENKNNDVVREVNKLRPDLPEDLQTLEVQRAASSDVAIQQIAISSPTASYPELEATAEELKRRLEKVKLLKRVETLVYPEQEVEVSINLEKMATNRLGLNQVLGAIQSNNVNIPGGNIDLSTRRYNIETTSTLETVEDLRNVVVQAEAGGRVVRLRDVATVRMGLEEITNHARYNGTRAVWVTVMLKDLKNIVAADKEVKPIIAEFEKTLPDHIQLDVGFDQAQYVQRRLGGLGRDFLIAVSLVLLTLIPLGWRSSLVVMISIPLSLAIGLALLDLFNYSLNQLSIVGLVVSLGLLVDDSIVVVENIERFIRQGYNRKKAAVVATKQIGIAVVGCTATLLLAFLPLAFLPEGSGDFIRSLPMAVIFTVIASFFVAITIIPFLSSLLLAEHERPEGNWAMRAFQQYINEPYKRLLERAFRFPALTLLIVAGIFGASLLLVPLIGFSVFPMSEKTMFLINVEAPLGTNLDETDRIVRQVEDMVGEYEEVVSISTNVGRGNPRVYYNEFPRQVASNYGQLFVQTDPGMHVPEITALTDALRYRLDSLAGADIQVTRFQQGPPVEAPIDIRIVGNNLDSLRAFAAQLEEIMEDTEGTIYVDNDLAIRKTNIQVVIDRQKAGLYGISVAEIARTIRLGIAGLDVSDFRTDDGEEYAINVSVEKEEDEVDEVFSRIYLTSMSGALIPLAQVATLELTTSPSVLRHFNKERFANVSCFVETGYNVERLTDEILERIETINLPPAYTIIPGGERETGQESFGGMGSIIIIATFGLLGILVLEFRTFKSTLIVLSVIPLGIIGALVALYLIGETLSFTSTVGMIALVGIEIKNSILLVDYTNQLREQGMSLDEAVRVGAETRFLPILLTTVTAIGGLIPLILERSPLISPLAWVIVGGLISSLLFSRIVTPLLYRLLPPRVRVKEELV